MVYLNNGMGSGNVIMPLFRPLTCGSRSSSVLVIFCSVLCVLCCGFFFFLL